jgi:hypothetical protein
VRARELLRRVDDALREVEVLGARLERGLRPAAREVLERVDGLARVAFLGREAPHGREPDLESRELAPQVLARGVQCCECASGRWTRSPQLAQPPR